MFKLPTIKKYKKIHNKILKRRKKNLNKLAIGTIALISKKKKTLKLQQFKSIFRISLRAVKKYKGYILVRTLPTIPITKKPIEVRMGKGVGKINNWICFVNPNTIVLELDGIPVDKSNEIIKIIATRMHLNFDIVSNQKFIRSNEEINKKKNI